MKSEGASDWARALESLVHKELRSMSTGKNASASGVQAPRHDHKLTLVEEVADSRRFAHPPTWLDVTPLELAFVILRQPDEEHVPPELRLPPLCRLVLLAIIHRSSHDSGVLRSEISRRELAKATGIDRSKIFSRYLPVLEKAGYVVRERTTLTKPGGSGLSDRRSSVCTRSNNRCMETQWFVDGFARQLIAR